MKSEGRLVAWVFSIRELGAWRRVYLAIWAFAGRNFSSNIQVLHVSGL